MLQSALKEKMIIKPSIKEVILKIRDILKVKLDNQKKLYG